MENYLFGFVTGVLAGFVFLWYLGVTNKKPKP